MAINLVKGQKIDLKKSSGGDLSRVMIGLGWDPVKKRGLFGPASVDCDASAFLLSGGQLVDQRDVVAFFNLKHRSKSVMHSGDNLTGAGDGDDEEILVDLLSVPEMYDRIVIVVNIYLARRRHQQFGMIQNAFVRIVDMENNEELLRYNLSGSEYEGKTAMIFGEIYRHNGKWKFSAIGEATTDDSIEDLSRRYI